MLATMSIGFVSCGGDDEPDEPDFVVTPSKVTMHYDDQKQLTAEGAVSWTTNDEFIADVNQTGLVEAKHVGSTKIVVSNGKRTTYCDVEITPKYTLIDIPLLYWGSSRSSIQSAELHPQLGEITNDNILAYNYTLGSTAGIVMYVFENNKLKSIMALLNKSMYLDAGYYLLERFQPIATGSSTDVYFMDAMSREKAKTVGMLDYYKLDGTTFTCIFYSDINILNSSTRGVANRPEIPAELIDGINNYFAK